MVILFGAVLSGKKWTMEEILGDPENKMVPILVDSFSELKKVITENDYVLVFSRKSVKEFLNMGMNIREVLKSDLQIKVVIFNAITVASEGLKVYNFTSFPSIDFFIHQHKQTFTGPKKGNTLKIWVDEVMAAKVHKIDSHEQIEQIDQHYFLHVDESMIAEHSQKLEALARIISPLRIYTGISNSFKRKVQKTAFFAYRKYDNKVFSIDIKKDIVDLNKYIRSKEYVKVMACTQSAFEIVVDLKIPVLVHFVGTEPKVFEEKLIPALIFTKSQYLLLLVVTPKSMNKCSKFMRQFLEVEHKNESQLRILNMVDKVRRYNFVGEIEKSTLYFFVDNYIKGNLKSYKINENLRSGETMNGVALANTDTLTKIRTNRNSITLVYVFDLFTKTVSSDLRMIKKIRDKMSVHPMLKFYAIDHTKNDIDGYYNNDCPFVFLILPNGKFVVMDKNLTAKNIVSFITEYLPRPKENANVEGEL